MKVNELKDDPTTKRWLTAKGFKPNTHKGYLLAMQHYTEYTQKIPAALIQEAKADIKAGKLMDERSIIDDIAGYRNYLQGKKLAPLSIMHFMAAVKSFYKFHYIEVPTLQHKVNRTKLKQNKKVPDKETIQQALSVCGIRERAIMLCGLSSGMGAAEISTLTLAAFREGYDPETGITTLDMTRVKVGRDFITFLSPEASKAVLAYLEHRDRPTRTGRQVDKDTQKKQRTTTGSYLFITEHVPKEYLETGNEELRRLRPDAILKVYRKISDHAGLDSAPNVYNMIRSHNMRKWFNSTLKREGCDSDTVEYFMGHTIGATKEAYLDREIDGGTEALKAIYAKFVPYLTIQKELDVAVSEEYKKIVEENQVLRAETARHVVERSELQTIKDELEALKNEIRPTTYRTNVAGKIESIIGMDNWANAMFRKKQFGEDPKQTLEDIVTLEATKRQIAEKKSRRS